MATSTAPAPAKVQEILADSRIVYLVLYVYDMAESQAFYENILGLRVLEADEQSVKFDAGPIILCLHLAEDYDVTLSGRQDDSSDVVFLVDDINQAREALEARGVNFIRRRTYEIGLVTDFYDPNGHRLMIYQPSEKALSWPSGDALRTAWRSFGKGGSDLIGPASAPRPEHDPDGLPPGLDGSPLVYLFMFVPDSDDAKAYYQGDLGLNLIENVHCCNPACPPEELGIAKYACGGFLLSTHHVHRTPVVDDFGRIYSPKSVNAEHARSIAAVFHVEDLEEKVEQLTANGVNFPDGIVRSLIGYLGRFEASTGHVFYLYKPSPEAMMWPTGDKIKAILEA